MELTRIQNGDHLTLIVKGRINAANAPQFGQEVEQMIKGITDLTFDFNSLEYISSAGLRMLLVAQRTMNRQGTMRITGVSEDVYNVLEETGFTGICDVELA